jgi:hypothetical protein
MARRTRAEREAAEAAFERQAEEQREAIRRKWPDGEPDPMEPYRWYRHITDKGTRWLCGSEVDLHFLGLPYGLAEVTDTGRSFRWSVSCPGGYAGEWDAGYARSLAAAKSRAEEALNELVSYWPDDTDLKQPVPKPRERDDPDL